MFMQQMNVQGKASGRTRECGFGTVRTAFIAILMAACLFLPIAAFAAAPTFMATAPSASQAKTYVAKGKSIQITGRYLAAGDKVSTYKSSNTKVASISKTGKVKAVKVGKATITLTTKKGRKDTIVVEVLSKVAAAKTISITKAKTLKVNDQYRPSVKQTPTKSTSTVKWTSSNKKVATVDAVGYVKALKAGKATIKATTSSGKSASCTITVTDPVTISKASASVREGKTIQLSASAASGAVTWQSADDGIATVDTNGIVTGVAPGTVVIQAVSAGGSSASCTVSVTPLTEASGMTISKTSATIYASNTLSLSASLVSEDPALPPPNDVITWSSSDPAVATVSANGLVTGIGFGKATITATAEGGASASCEVTVKTIKATKTSVTLQGGVYYDVKFTTYGLGSSPVLTYASSNKSIATVTAAGRVAVNLRNSESGQLKTGTATITATTAAGDKATMKVVVIDSPTIVDLSKWQGNIDWASASKSIDLAILRVSYGNDTAIEPKYASYSSSCDRYVVPYGAYSYARYSTKAQAEQEATTFYNTATAGGREPFFFVVDIEEKQMTRAATEAYLKKLRALARQDGIQRLKVGLYIGHHLYKQLGLNVETDLSNDATPDFIWIPRYGSNTGTVDASPSIPDFPCDLWQFSSSGYLPGISGKVDMNTLYDHDMVALTDRTGTGRSYFSFDWLTTRLQVGEWGKAKKK
jgi:uncharacterized protein YjdB